MSETTSLFPEPVCNAIQEFVPAIELLEYGFPYLSGKVLHAHPARTDMFAPIDCEYGFPVSSPSGDEPSGACASSAASSSIT